MKGKSNKPDTPKKQFLRNIDFNQIKETPNLRNILKIASVSFHNQCNFPNGWFHGHCKLFVQIHAIQILFSSVEFKAIGGKYIGNKDKFFFIYLINLFITGFWLPKISFSSVRNHISTSENINWHQLIIIYFLSWKFSFLFMKNHTVLHKDATVMLMQIWSDNTLWLTHLSQVGSLICISWTIPFISIGVLFQYIVIIPERCVSGFHLYQPNSDQSFKSCVLNWWILIQSRQ